MRMMIATTFMRMTIATTFMRMTIATTFMRMTIAWLLQKYCKYKFKRHANSADCILELVRPFTFEGGHSNITYALKPGGGTQKSVKNLQKRTGGGGSSTNVRTLE